MRGFFIRGMEMIINVVVVVGIIGIIATTIAVWSNPYGGGGLPALGLLIGGTLTLVLTAGGIYLGLGIYNNTRRTAEAVEKLLMR